MSTTSAEMEAIENLGKAVEQFQKKNDAALEELRTKGYVDPLLKAQVDKMSAEVGELATIKAQLQELETKAARPNIVGLDGKPIREQLPEVIEHTKAFDAWFKKGVGEHELAGLQLKAVRTGVNPDGGYAVPEIVDTNIIRLGLEISPMRQDCKVVRVSTPEWSKLVDEGGTDSGWVGEESARTETETSKLTKIAPYIGEIYANPKATARSMEDMWFDPATWIAENVAERFASQEGAAFVSGNGVLKPKGFLAYPISLEVDGTRAYGTIQRLVTGVADAWATAPAAGDVFIDTVQSLRPRHRNGCKWRCNALTVGDMRQFKDSNGDYMWRAGLQLGVPDTFLGYAITEDEEMPDVAADAYPVALANWQNAYTIVDIGSSTMLRDPYSDKPFVSFYTTKRVGGMVENTEAIKLIRIDA